MEKFDKSFKMFRWRRITKLIQKENENIKLNSRG